MISRVALAVYVNNLLLTGKNKKDILYVKQFLKQRFKVKDLGKVRMFLDIKVKKFEQYMTLDQLQYVAMILRQFLDKKSLLYLIFMEPDVDNKLAATRKNIFSKNQKYQYL